MSKNETRYLLISITVALTFIIGLLVYYFIKLYERKNKIMNIKTLKLSAVGRAELKKSEGVRYKAYRDSGGLYTTGVGHLITPSEDYLIDKTLTAAEVEAIFSTDIAKAEAVVRSKISVDVSQGLFDALVSLAFNTGTIYNSIVELVIKGDMAALAAKWKTTAITVNNGRTVIDGLRTRRIREVQLFA